MAKHILDLRGEICPITLVKTLIKLEDINDGDRLTVLLDYEPATRNLPKSLPIYGHRVEQVQATGPSLWAVELVKAGLSADSGSNPGKIPT